MNRIGPATRFGIVAVICVVTYAAFTQVTHPRRPLPPQARFLPTSAGILAYPAKGQSPQQQRIDESECYNWSKQQSGYGPQPPSSPSPPAKAAPMDDPPDDIEFARDAVQVPAVSALGEAAAGRAGRSAPVAAVCGGSRGVTQSQREEHVVRRWKISVNQAQPAQSALRDSFKRRMVVCLEARGYVVK